MVRLRITPSGLPLILVLGLIPAITGCLFSSKPASETASLNNMADKVALLTPSDFLVGTSLTFPKTSVGSSSDIEYQFTNSGGSPASRIQFSMTEGLLPPFAFKGGTFPGTGGFCPDPLPVGGICKFVLSFSPTQVGLQNSVATIEYFNGVITAPLSLDLSGETGPGLTVSEYPVWKFGSSSVPITKTFTIRNDSQFMVLQPLISLQNGSPAFPITNNQCTFDLPGAPPGNTCTFDIVFTPGLAGPRTENVKIEYPADGENKTLYLSLEGTSPGWKGSTAPALPSPRFDHTAVWTGSQVIIWGGQQDAAGTLRLNSGAKYDPVSDTWAPITTVNAPLARSLHSAVWTGSKMIIWGGVSNAGIPLDTGAMYDPISNTWTDTSTFAVPTARFQHSAVWTGSKMIVFGGLKDNSPSGILTNVAQVAAAFDPALDSANGGTWTSLPTANMPVGRYLHTATWTGSKMIIWGGCLTRPAGMLCSTETNDGGIFDPGAGSWSLTSTATAPSPRFWHSAVWTGTSLMIWGGTSANGTADFATGGVYLPDTDQWAPIPLTGSPPLARRGHLGFWIDDRMVIWGGFSDAGHAEIFDPSKPADAWISIPLGAGADRDPISTLGATGTAVIQGADRRLIFFGGRDTGTASIVNSTAILFP